MIFVSCCTAWPKLTQWSSPVQLQCILPACMLLLLHATTVTICTVSRIVPSNYIHYSRWASLPYVRNYSLARRAGSSGWTTSRLSQWCTTGMTRPRSGYECALLDGQDQRFRDCQRRHTETFRKQWMHCGNNSNQKSTKSFTGRNCRLAPRRETKTGPCLGMIWSCSRTELTWTSQRSQWMKLYTLRWKWSPTFSRPDRTRSQSPSPADTRADELLVWTGSC